MASKLVTVFGGSGFLGRQIVKCLADAERRVRVAVRHPDRATFLSGFGPDGRIELVQADVWDETTVARVVEGSASVVNTVGHYVEKSGATFDRVHGQGALHVARQAKQAGAERLVHISGVGADPGSPSPYVRARGIGETLVKEAFDDVTILRPSVIFGPGDSFLNTLARMTQRSPVMPLFGTGSTRLQPVFVGDVAEACVRVLAEPSTRGKMYELGGPRVYAYRELVRLVRERVAGRALMVPVPFLVWDALAAVMAAHPEPPLTGDQVTLMKRDNVVGGQAPTLHDLGIRPVSVEEAMPACIDAVPS
ncbi:MAG: complex I NDUFA9 subunit family protein [Rhodospirillales bacterium]|nr:complex I NDUFA9 subunit family protein [Rhodospirillales bacterium]